MKPVWSTRTGWGRGLVAAAVTVAAISCSNSPPDDRDYVTKLSAERTAKDTAFVRDAEPVPQDRKKELLPLAYFPIDPEYSVPAQLEPIDDPTVLDMPTSTGTQRKMRRVGALQFTLKGQPMKLTAFVEVEAPDLNRLFVPFSDMTSGTETYPAGRYLDLERSKTGVYVLDFNRAYHPYCYYNPTWDCPYPPAENRLKMPVRAGEKRKS